MDAPQLTGQHVRLWPYVRGLYPRDLPYRLWAMLEAEGGGETLFYGQVTPQTEVDTRGDLLEFCRSFDPSAGRYLLTVEAIATGELAGLWWFDDYVPKARACINVWMRRRYWGEPTQEACRLAIGYGFAVLDIPAIWAFTPWPMAQALAVRAGFTHVATLPGFVPIKGTLRDVQVYRLPKEGRP